MIISQLPPYLHPQSPPLSGPISRRRHRRGKTKFHLESAMPLCFIRFGCADLPLLLITLRRGRGSSRGGHRDGWCGVERGSRGTAGL